jgi:hypothetical protein
MYLRANIVDAEAVQVQASENSLHSDLHIFESPYSISSFSRWDSY